MIFSAYKSAGVGKDDATPFTADYQKRSNAFAGRILKVVVDVKPMGVAVKGPLVIQKR